VIPELQAFYGGDVERWLDMPIPLLECYAEMKPRLEANENIRAANIVALGMGNLEKLEQARLLGSWERAAAGRRKARTARPGDLAAMGIAYEVVDVKQE
jgi:hypothetical protein